MQVLTAIVIFLLLSLLLSCFIWFVLTVRSIKRDCAKQLAQEKERSEERFQKLIHDFNHTGPIPPAGSVVGMTNLISWEAERILKQYKELLEKKEWNTEQPTLRLQNVMLNELLLLNAVVKRWLESRQLILKEFNKDQGL